jgi:short-subunit dehydrogenase
MTRFLITGASRGIGAALAAEAEARGHEVIRTTRTGAGGDIALPLDDPSAVAEALAGLEGAVDVLINNAGIIGPDRQSTLDMDWAGMAQTFAVNTMAPLAVAQAVLPALRRSKSPRILTISTQMSTMTYAKSDRIAYRASKVAVNKVMQGLSTDLAPEGIAVALINPGWVRTDMGGAQADETPEDVARGVLDIAERMTMADTGKFFRFSGEEFPF